VGEVGVEFIDDGGAALPTIPDCFALDTVGLRSHNASSCTVQHLMALVARRELFANRTPPDVNAKYEDRPLLSQLAKNPAQPY
jgi:hypothetical protein